MQLQMQQQQARQQTQLQQPQLQQRQQVTDMLKPLVTMQNAALPSFGGVVSSATKGLDERQFRRILKFDNKNDS